MKPRHFSSNGVVLKRHDFGETDRILVIYSKHFGKLSMIAKGIKKPESKKRGSLEVFSHIKFAGHAGAGLDIITEAETIEHYSEIRQDLKKVSVAYYLVEVVNKTTNDAEYHPEIYELLTRYLEILKVTNSLKKFRLDFTYQMLVKLGYWPENVKLDDPDTELEKVIERTLHSVRVGKKVLYAGGETEA